MTKFIIEQSFWDIFPDAEIGIVLAKGIDNTQESNTEIKAALKQANTEALKYLPSHTLSENPVVAVWRDAYRKFNTKKGTRSSIENLLKRASKGNEVGSINPLVDIYNTISLRYAIPCGGEDIDTFVGDLRLTQTEGGDVFRALGDEQDSETIAGEVCYVDDAGAVCRFWNWRDGVRTMLTENTTNAFLIIESVDPSRHEDIEKAIQELAESTEKHLGGEIETFILNRNNPSHDIA